MGLNELAISTIKSNYIKNYLSKINHMFTLEEQITLIFNSDINLDDKLSIYNKYLHDTNIDKYNTKDLALFKQCVRFIIECANTVQDWMQGTAQTVIMFKDETTENIVCCNNLITFIDIANTKLSNIDNKEYISIYVCDIYTSDILAWIEINNKFEVIRYTFTNEKMYSGIEDKYIDIPNDIHIGDIVTLTGDSDEIRYVVTHDSTIPNHLRDKSSFSIDSCVTIVPEYIFDKCNNYKEEIDRIVKNRINNIENDVQSVDILMEEHDHINIRFIEKI